MVMTQCHVTSSNLSLYSHHYWLPSIPPPSRDAHIDFLCHFLLPPTGVTDGWWDSVGGVEIKVQDIFETFSILILIFPSNFWNALSKSKNDPPICIKFGIEFVKKNMLYHIICWVIFHYNVPTKDKILIHIILQNIVLRSYLVFRRKISSYHFPYYPSNSPLCVTRDSIIWRFGPCFTVLLYNEIQCGF